MLEKEPDFTADGRVDNHWLYFRQKFVGMRGDEPTCMCLVQPNHLWVMTAEGHLHIYDTNVRICVRVCMCAGARVCVRVYMCAGARACVHVCAM